MRDLSEEDELKPVEFVGSSRKDLRSFPKSTREVVGKALFAAQGGRKHRDAKPLAGFGDAGVLEIVADDAGNAYRAVYTVRLADVVYVLHAFQKKSKRGVTTPAEEMRKIRSRLLEAKRLHEDRPK